MNSRAMQSNYVKISVAEERSVLKEAKKDIWAASIIYVIARLNFLFDKENDYYITSDTICNFFKTKKSTVGNKATEIQKICKLGLGAE